MADLGGISSSQNEHHAFIVFFNNNENLPVKGKRRMSQCVTTSSLIEKEENLLPEVKKLVMKGLEYLSSGDSIRALPLGGQRQDKGCHYLRE